MGRRSVASRLIVFLALFAFSLQSYAVQTHIHGASQDVGAIAKILSGPAPAKHKRPLDEGPVDCRYCQTAALAGVFLAPSTLLLHLPLVWVKSAMSLSMAGAFFAVAAHNWQSRAPPRH